MAFRVEKTCLATFCVEFESLVKATESKRFTAIAHLGRTGSETKWRSQESSGGVQSTWQLGGGSANSSSARGAKL